MYTKLVQQAVEASCGGNQGGLGGHKRDYGLCGVQEN